MQKPTSTTAGRCARDCLSRIDAIRALLDGLEERVSDHRDDCVEELRAARAATRQDAIDDLADDVAAGVYADDPDGYADDLHWAILREREGTDRGEDTDSGQALLAMLDRLDDAAGLLAD